MLNKQAKSILETAARAQANWEAFMREMGHEPHTTFFSDFTIADAYGAKAIKETYERVFKEWKSNTQYITELAMVLNHKCWYFHDDGNDEYSLLYGELWGKVDNWCLENLKGDDLSYYFETTD